MAVTTTNEERLGNAVRRRRIGLGMTQQQAASSAGVSPTTWRSIEQGAAGVRRELTLRAIDRVLRWPPGTAERVLDGAGPPVADLIEEAEGASTHAHTPSAAIDFNSKVARLSPEDRAYVEGLVNRLLEED